MATPAPTRIRASALRLFRAAERLVAVLAVRVLRELGYHVLATCSTGDGHAMAGIFPHIYDELRRLAHRQLQNEPGGQTLSTTGLVHEAYIRLIDQTRVQWSGRAHFMAIAATAMRRILIDRARRHGSHKRGGPLQRVPLESVQLAAEDRAGVLLALDDALERLKQLNERQAQVVECRFFGGMTEEETAGCPVRCSVGAARLSCCLH
jgi:RNA polymerase sigma factor (TIGR02999 family)